MRVSRSVLRLGAILACAWLAWLVVLIAVPMVIEAAYNERSFAFVNVLLSGRDQHPLGRYLEVWSGLARKASLGLAALSVLAVALFPVRTRLAATMRRGIDVVSIPVPTGLARVAVLACVIGMLAGLLEIAVQATTYTARAWPTGDFYWDKVWLTPLAMALSMLVIAVPLYALTRPWRADSTLGLVPAIMLTIAAYAVARAVGGILPFAALALAAGVSVALCRNASRNPQRAVRIFIRTGVVLTVSISLFAGGLHARRWIGERGALASPGESSAAGPNVLMIILDTVRAPSMSLYGHDRETTPRIDRFAQRGIVFENAWAPTAWTLPSHASLFTGRPAADLQTDYEVGLDDAPPTLAEAFAANGYATAGFVANFYYASRQSGLARGFAHYEDHPINFRALVTSAWLPRRIGDRIVAEIPYFDLPPRKRADRINGDFLHWLESRPDRPFFAFLNYLDAHDPYDPPEPYRSRFGGGTGRYGLGFNQEYPADALQSLENHYDGALSYLDAYIGDLLERLDSDGILDNTLVIITADHGEQFGEHGPRFVMHGRSLYSPGLHVPLIVVGPDRVPSNARVGEPVALANVAATVLDLAGAGSPLPGTSLTRFWEGADSAAVATDTIISVATQNPRQGRLIGLPIERGPMRSLLVDRWHLIVNGDGEQELYDVIADPWEQSDLITTPAGKSKAAEVRALLDARTPPRFAPVQRR